MNKTLFRKQFLRILIIFIIVNSFCLLFGKFLDEHKIDHVVLIAANALLFAITFIAFTLFQKALQNSNPNVFVRSIMLSMIIKLLVVAFSVLAYFYFAKQNRSVHAVIVSMILYIFYTVAEVKGALQMNRQSNGSN